MTLEMTTSFQDLSFIVLISSLLRLFLVVDLYFEPTDVFQKVQVFRPTKQQGVSQRQRGASLI